MDNRKACGIIARLFPKLRSAAFDEVVNKYYLFYEFGRALILLELDLRIIAFSLCPLMFCAI